MKMQFNPPSPEAEDKPERVGWGSGKSLFPIYVCPLNGEKFTGSPDKKKKRASISS